MKLRPVIMAGGSGTRFWPLSRRKRPKQLLPLASGKPLLVDTVARLASLATVRDVLIACGRPHVTAIRRMLPKIPRSGLIVEPIGRNTAPCVAVASAIVARRTPEDIVAVLPADAYVADASAFRRDLGAAAEAARGGSLVTLGIRPTRPETGYGYIEVGEQLAQGAAHRAERFVEKPDRAQAEKYLTSGRFLWNAGIFVFRADAMLAALDQFLPEVANAARSIAGAHGTTRFDSAMRRSFPKLPSISIDYGVMEKAPNVLVVPASFGWSDLGSFAALPEVRGVDGSGNLIAGHALALDSAGSLVLADKRLIAVLGVRDMVVVDSGDALLVCPKDRCQEVRRIVDELAKRGLSRLL
jgi:mannose-1-phosphate guanylyltransferase